MNREPAPRVVIAYDGSPGAQAAVRVAADLFAGGRAFVATAPQDVNVRAGLAIPAVGTVSATAVQELFDVLIAEAEREAGETAHEAVELARGLGLEAEVATVPPFPPVAAALLETAHRLGADVLM